MKLLITLITTIIINVTLAAQCNVTASDKELEDGVNKDTICRETLFALFSTTEVAENVTLEIEALGERQMYSVELTKIAVKVDNKITLETNGLLVWYPGDAYVLLAQ